MQMAEPKQSARNTIATNQKARLERKDTQGKATNDTSQGRGGGADQRSSDNNSLMREISIRNNKQQE